MTGINPGRRHVVRAGAWTVPAIAVATAAPAFATSGADMRGSIPTPPRTNAFTKGGTGNVFYVDGAIRMGNIGTGPTTQITITVEVQDGVSQTAANHTPPTQGGTWTVEIVSATQVRFIAPASLVIAGPSGTLDVTFRVRRSGGNGGTSVSAVVDPGGNGTPGTVGPSNV